MNIDNFKAWEAGHLAYNTHKSLDDNPYMPLTDLNKHLAWGYGFCRAQIEANGD